MKPPSVMKLSPGIYSKKESYKTESHKANLTVQVEAFNCSVIYACKELIEHGFWLCI